jgi:uncharacterized protein YyaL (SSP411 family)
LSQNAKGNHLVGEKSPYLLEHATNPVDWYPWSEEALRKAKNDGKPILLSIGYSSCHWCHVMRKESFEDPATAAKINKYFIPIKVDREERPELDAFYMNAVQMMTGGGGWPLTVFLTPDLRPFYGGTYYPPEPRYGMPSFGQVLDFVAKIWRERREEALENAQQVFSALEETKEPVAKGKLSPDLIEGTYASLASSYDAAHGGFGTAPKFPLPLSISFMLRYHYRTGKELALSSATKTLDAMAAGGIRDHLGGGFHRYSTDRVWLVPHFEKMLYDNALLAKVFAEAYQITGNRMYATVTDETLAWMIREMRAPQGGFHSAQDADSEEGEGVFYTWTPEEIEGALGRDDAIRFCREYGVSRAGNFEGGRSILHLTSQDGTDSAWTDSAKKKLYDVRARRPRPSTDTKVLTSWNGLAISALALAGGIFGDKTYINEADRAADFVLTRCQKGGRLQHRYAGGEAGIDGLLEDYAFLAQGLLDLFRVTQDPGRLAAATRIVNDMVEGFYDGEQGGFFMSREASPAKLKEAYDGPTPSGNSVAVLDLLRLSELTGKTELQKVAEKTLVNFRMRLEEQPASHACMMSALDTLLNGSNQVVITASQREEVGPMQAEVTKAYLPATEVVVADSEGYDELLKLSPLLEGRKPGPLPTAYVCENFVCKIPAKSPEELRKQLSALGH